ncbi:MAG TPA: N-acetyltransferase [Patescibacteria group bacterium]|nr:N-acetyltransferase [Patescibacteria group bacterium]
MILRGEVMYIRHFKQEDASEYWALRLRALEECPESFGASYEEEKGKPISSIAQRLKESYEATDSESILGCYDEENRLIGIVGLFREKREKLRHKATINAMYVAPEARTKGAGKALLMEAINRGKQMKGLEQINLGVVVTNTEAKSLYKRCGFEVYGVEKNALKLPDKYLDEELMVYML